MILILLIGLVLTAVAVTLVVRVLLVSRLGVAESLGRIGRYGFAGTVELSPTGGLRGFLDDAAGAVGGFVIGRPALFEETSLRKLLITDGMYRVSPRMLLGYQALLAVCLPALWLWLGVTTGMKVPLTVVGFFIAIV